MPRQLPNLRLFAFRSTAFLGLLGMFAGCARPQPALAPTKPTEVLVASPIVKDVTAFEDFTGRIEAVAAVDVRARVTGYLQEVNFKDGTDVKKGDLLFVIDPSLYQAELDKAAASVLLAEAHLDRVEKDQRRITALANKQAVTQAEADLIAGEREEAAASLKLAQAQRRLVQQNLDWTRITAPMSGRISRRAIDAGNLVKADDTILTSIVSIETMYAYFDVDERTLLRIRRLIQQGKVYSTRAVETHVQIGLADEDNFSHEGVINFAENKLDPATGTLRVRAVVSNSMQNAVRLLSPGLFVRIRFPIGVPHPALLVPEEAIGTDQGQKYVYVVGTKDEVIYRAVKLGDQYDRFRVVETGLSPGERIIVSGLQRVRPGVKVTAKPLEPTDGGTAAKSTVTAKPAAQPKPVAEPKPAEPAPKVSSGAAGL